MIPKTSIVGVTLLTLTLTLTLALALGGCGGGGGGSGGGGNQAPLAVISLTPSSGPSPLFVVLSAGLSQDPDGTIVSAAWDFGDLTQGAGVTVGHSYPAPGNYTVTLVVTDDLGAQGLRTATVAVSLPGTPQPPEQPAFGPGGSNYSHAAVTATQVGATSTSYWVFEPADPVPTSAPLIVFVHGYTAIDPAPYRDWIDHLVKRGNVVVYPVYQTFFTLPVDFTPNAITGIQSALTLLRSGGHVEPETDKAAIAGHSFGGVISADIAATAALNGLPVFRAVLCAEPGTAGFGPYADYAQIPSGTLLLCVVGNDDAVVGDTDGKKIYDEAVQVSAGDKDFIRIFADTHGDPDLLADHNAPLAGTLFDPDGMDWYGFWKWLDALTDAAFYGTNRDLALGNTAEQRFLGYWSDGTPVTEATVTDSP